MPNTMHNGKVNSTSSTVLVSNSPTRGRQISASICVQPICHDTPITNAIGSSANNETSTDKPVTQVPPTLLNKPWGRLRGGAWAMPGIDDSGSNQSSPA